MSKYPFTPEDVRVTPIKTLKSLLAVQRGPLFKEWPTIASLMGLGGSACEGGLLSKVKEVKGVAVADRNKLLHQAGQRT